VATFAETREDRFASYELLAHLFATGRNVPATVMLG
jgi:hypothetical protein